MFDSTHYPYRKSQWHSNGMPIYMNGISNANEIPKVCHWFFVVPMVSPMVYQCNAIEDILPLQNAI